MNNRVCAKQYCFCGEFSVRTLRDKCPVLTESAALLKDLREDKYYVRCLFCNLTEEPLRELIVDVILKKNEIKVGSVENFRYEAFGAEVGMCFGQTVGIPIDTAEDFDSVSILLKKAIFESGAEENADGETLEIPQQERLTEFFGEPDLAEEFVFETQSQGDLVPVKRGEYWCCSCGQINSEEKCSVCGADKKLLFSKLDSQALSEELIHRREEAEKAAEEARLKKEEEERILAAEEAKRKAAFRKKTRQIAIISAILIAAAIGIYLFVDKALPIIRYNSADSAFGKGDYEKAYTTFVKLGEYKDSSTKGTEAYYRYGLSCIENGDYENAEQIFTELGNYEDSQKNLKEARYLSAESLVNDNKYSEAVEIFRDLKNYNDSADKKLEAMYGYVKNHQDSKDKTTYEYMCELKKASYKDAEKTYKELYAWKAKLLINNSDSDTKNAMEKIEKYDKIYCHVVLEGGEPGAKTKLKYSAKYPNGSVASGVWDKQWEEGTDGQCVFWYDIPEYGTAGSFSVTVYDVKSGMQIGKSSVELTD